MATTITLKNFEIVNLQTALKLLDNPDKLRETTDENGRVISLEDKIPPFRFNAAAIYAFSRNQKKLQAVIDSFDEVRKKVFSKYQETADQEKLEGDKAKDFVKEWESFLKETSDVDVIQIKVSDLNLAESKVPISILSELLDRIVVEDEEKKDLSADTSNKKK